MRTTTRSVTATSEVPGTMSCINCRHKSFCLPAVMEAKDIHKLNAIIMRSPPLRPGENLYKGDEPLVSIFVVHSGSIKTSLLDSDGVEQVTGFSLPGELAGLDGLGTGLHGNNVVAMETASVCKIPFIPLLELARKIPGLQYHLFKLMSRQIETDFWMLLNLSKKSALARLAIFLVGLSQRFGMRNYSFSAYRLPMSRMDMGNFLGLTIETISRNIGILHREDIIAVSGRELVIKDFARLELLANNDQASVQTETKQLQLNSLTSDIS